MGLWVNHGTFSRLINFLGKKVAGPQLVEKSSGRKNEHTSGKLRNTKVWWGILKTRPILDLPRGAISNFSRVLSRKAQSLSAVGLFAVPVTGTAVVSAGVQRANPSRVRPVRKIPTARYGRRNGRHGQRDGDGAFADDKLGKTSSFCLGNIRQLQVIQIIFFTIIMFEGIRKFLHYNFILSPKIIFPALLTRGRKAVEQIRLNPSPVNGRGFDGRHLENPSRHRPVEIFSNPSTERVGYPSHGTRRTGTTGTVNSPTQPPWVTAPIKIGIKHLHERVRTRLSLFEVRATTRRPYNVLFVLGRVGAQRGPELQADKLTHFIADTMLDPEALPAAVPLAVSHKRIRDLFEREARQNMAPHLTKNSMAVAYNPIEQPQCGSGDEQPWASGQRENIFAGCHQQILSMGGTDIILRTMQIRTDKARKIRNFLKQIHARITLTRICSRFMFTHARIVGKAPDSTRQRRAFQCPEEDKRGSPKTGQSSSATANSGPNGSSSQTTLTCIYDGGAGDCEYDETCPDGTPESTPESKTQIVTQTQTQFVTETAEPSPPPLTSTSSSQNTSPSSASLSPSPSSNSENSSTFPFLSSSQVALPSLSSGSASQTSNTSLPVGGQSLVGSSNSLAAGAIAGIAIGVVAVLILAIILALCVRRARRHKRTADLAPESYFIVSPGRLAEYSVKGLVSDSLESISSVAQNRQEYLTAQLSAVQKQLEALQASVGTGGAHLEQAMQQNEALRARIRMLEREMQSQWGLGLTDSPPAYLD
ncbi:hypothetical protein B0H19DRAFT_1289127 [Mycena capillaripes]|nr:hypothetical protein B0H19DRAFT_1289127 [Mycena capillaripes]